MITNKTINDMNSRGVLSTENAFTLELFLTNTCLSDEDKLKLLYLINKITSDNIVKNIHPKHG
jgi:hypothetical protein